MAPSSTGRLSGLRSALPVSNTTPGSLISSLNEQPIASTRSPFGVSGHLSALSTTPSPSVSSSQPFSSTLAPGRRVRALVAAVADAITIAVELAAAGIDLGAGGRPGAFVDVVGHAVAVIVHRQRASAAVHRGAGGCARAFVEIVGHAVAIGVEHAADGVSRPRSTGCRDPPRSRRNSRRFSSLKPRRAPRSARSCMALPSSRYATQIDEQAAAVQRGEIRLVGAGLEDALDAGEPEAQERIHAAFAVEHAIARTARCPAARANRRRRGRARSRTAEICASQLVLSVRPKASVTPASSSATRPSSSHSALTCGAMYQLPSAAPANAVPLVNAAVLAVATAASTRVRDFFHGFSPGELALASARR